MRSETDARPEGQRASTRKSGSGAGRLARKEIRQLFCAVPGAEHRAIRLQSQTGFEPPGIDGVEAEPIDQLKYSSDRGAVIAGRRDGDAARRARGRLLFSNLK